MPFWELSVAASADTAEGVTNFLWEQGALGVVEEAAAGGPPALRAFFPESVAADDLLAATRAYRDGLAALGFAVPAAPPRLVPVADQAWATAWQAFFTPLPVGAGFLVVPPWRADAESPGRTRLVIEPARAFGTGHHGSTAGCLALLERAGVPGAGRVLDVGCGSGILGIAAARLGAARVTAVDVDPDAVAATRRNAALNGCADRLAASVGGPQSVAPGFELVLANLLAPAHLALGAEYGRLLAPGGRLILGGMLAGEDGAVAETLAAGGLGRADRVEVDGWAALTLLAP
jgi:ribosomal protein L11 methyltransferase